MDSPAVVPFLTPMVGALAAYILNRGSRLRRARTAALEDLQLHQRAEGIFGEGDPLTDQLRAHARESVRSYSARRSADDKRPIAWLAGAGMFATSTILGAVAVTLDVDNFWVLIAFGSICGAVGIAVETVLERLRTRRAVGRLPTTSVR